MSKKKSLITFSSHAGTHIDPPVQLSPGRGLLALDGFLHPLEHLDVIRDGRALFA